MNFKIYNNICILYIRVLKIVNFKMFANAFRTCARYKKTTAVLSTAASWLAVAGFRQSDMAPVHHYVVPDRVKLQHEDFTYGLFSEFHNDDDVEHVINNMKKHKIKIIESDHFRNKLLSDRSIIIADLNTINYDLNILDKKIIHKSDIVKTIVNLATEKFELNVQDSVRVSTYIRAFLVNDMHLDSKKSGNVSCCENIKNFEKIVEFINGELDKNKIVEKKIQELKNKHTVTSIKLKEINQTIKNLDDEYSELCQKRTNDCLLYCTCFNFRFWRIKFYTMNEHNKLIFENPF